MALLSRVLTAAVAIGFGAACTSQPTDSASKDGRPDRLTPTPSSTTAATASAPAIGAGTATPTAPGTGRREPVRTAEELLAPEPAKRFADRALLRAVPRTYWTLDTRAAASPPSEHDALFHPVELVVVEQQLERIRFVAETETVRYAAYVATADLREVVTATTRLEPSTGEPKSPLGVTLAPGFSADWSEIQGSRRQLTFADSLIRFTGSVDASKLGRVFRPEPLATTEATRVLPSNTPILDSPAGKAFAHTGQTLDGGPENTGQTTGVAVLEERDAHSRVVLQGPHYRVEGWVATANLTDGESFGSLGLAGTGFGGGGGGRTLSLAVGTRLFAGPQGAQTAVVTKEFRASFDDMEEGWRSLQFRAGALGKLTAWLDPESGDSAAELEHLLVRAKAKVKFLRVTNARGVEAEVAERAMRARERLVARCRVTAHQAGDAPAGSLVVMLDGDAKGVVSRARVSGPATSSARFKSCLEQVLALQRMPPARSGAGHIQAEFEIDQGSLHP